MMNLLIEKKKEEQQDNDDNKYLKIFKHILYNIL